MASPRFLISRNEKGLWLCSLSLLSNCIGKVWYLAIIASNSIHTGWHRLKQEQMPHSMSMYMSVLVMILQNSRCSTRHNAGCSFPNHNPGWEAGCRKEQYDANVLSCGHCKRQGFFWRTVFVSLQEGKVLREDPGRREPEEKAYCGSTEQMNGHSPELCDIFLCLCCDQEGSDT